MKATIANVAKAAGICEQTLRCMMQVGECDFGTAWKNDGCRNYAYIFYPAKLKEYFGDIWD